MPPAAVHMNPRVLNVSFSDVPNTMPESVRALEAFLARTVDQPGMPPAQFNVAICAHPEQFKRIASSRLQLTDSWEEAHFFIAPTHMNCDAMLKGEVVATVERLGTLLAVVKDRRTIVDPLEPKHDSGVSDPAAAINRRIP